jgi:iron complex outermembrane receptor protein
MMNAGVKGVNVYRKLGFSASVKYQSNYYWQSFLINGRVPAVFNADAMLQYSFTNPSFNLKVGAANILNHYYYSLLGGPQVGGFYYTTVTYSL